MLRYSRISSFANKQIFRPLSSKNVTSSKNITSSKIKFDKTAIPPLLLLLVVGSIAVNKIEQRNEIRLMEQRYASKMNKLQELIDRVKQGDTNFSVADELALVNKMFERYDASKDVRKYLEGNQPAVLNMTTGSTSQATKMEDESLQDVLNGLMKEIDGSGEVAGPSVAESRDFVIKDAAVSARQAEEEEEDRTYRPDTNRHGIVNIPGEYVQAAEGTDVPKFL